MDQQPAHPDREHVVVGVDGSDASTDALAWALRQASRHGWTVDVVTAWPASDEVFVHDVPGHFSAPRQQAVVAQDRAVAKTLAGLPDPPPVRTHVDNASPVAALCEHARTARMVVVGSQGGTHTTPTARASLGDSLALLVECPVVVLHEGGTVPGDHVDQRPLERASA